MTPDEVYAAHAAVEKYTQLLAEWRKAKTITVASLYYEGHQTTDCRNALMVCVKNAVINFYRQAVLDQYEVVLGMCIKVTLPEDWA